MRMAYCWTLDSKRQRLHAIIARLSVRDRRKYFVLEVRVHAYHRTSGKTSLAAQKFWQLVKLRLVKGDPEDVLPVQPITERTVVSSHNFVMQGALQALCLQQLQWRPLMHTARIMPTDLADLISDSATCLAAQGAR